MAQYDSFFATPDFSKFDFTSFLNPSNFGKGFEKLATQYSVPAVDPAELFKVQQKNLEALLLANRLAFQGVQAVAQRQAEIVRQSVDSTSKAISSFSAAKSNEERFETQADFVKESCDKTLANLRELTELNAKSGSEAFEVVNRRFSESLEELKAQIRKTAETVEKSVSNGNGSIQ